jgi:sugar diacid utilization regulator
MEITQASRLMLEALIERKGVQHILEQGYKMLGNPIGVGDPSTKLVAHYKCIFNDQPVWNKQIEQGFFSREITGSPSFFELNEKVMKSALPVMVEGAYTLPFRTITGKIKADNTILAFLSVFEYEQPFGEKDIELTALLCDAVSLEMQKAKSFKNIKGTAFESFLTDLLDGNIKDNDTIKERKDALGLNLKKDLYVMAVDLKKSSLNIHTIYLISLLEDMVGNSKGIFYNDQIVMLISREGESFTHTGIFTEKLDGFMRKSGLTAGLSRRFQDLREIKSYYSQACSALELGQYRDSSKVLHSFDQVTQYYALKICSNHIRLSELCHPAILWLMEYDQKRNTDYTQTLYVYLSHQGNQIESSNVLCIHRATLIYRIAKIHELTLLDLKDTDTVNQLNMSFMILKLMGKFSV